MRRILIVDDEFGLAETLRDLLEFEGYLATSAWNGQLALERLSTQPAELILTDLMMPIMDGRKLLRALRGHPTWEAIPVIAMSGAASLTEEERAQCAGFLRKPFDFDHLLALIRKLIGPGR